MKERAVKRELMLAVSNGPTRLFNNPVGVAVYPDGSRVRYGLCVGSSDFIGWHTITVTPDMVGRRMAVFAAAETKSARGRARSAQANFIRVVCESGGIAGIVRSTADWRKLLDEFLPQPAGG